jgi:rhodanese-related sulfurtransferase
MKKKNTVLLDVRTSEEYKAGHIPGAKQIDVLQPGNFEKEVSGFNKKKTYLLYCKSGKRSNNAKVMMKELGFSKLFDLKGGYSQWPGRTELK